MAGNGNPYPGFAHDTVIFHVQKAESGPKNCDGGHSLFLRHYDGEIPPTLIYLTMVDWVQIDNDGDGLYDEDTEEDGVDQDGDGSDGEDPLEPGATTTALDCDGLDGEISLQIRDTHPDWGIVSTQQGALRMIGKPEQNFAFTSFANQTVSCTSTDPGPDGFWYTEDDVVTCESGDSTDWVELASFNLADEGCVKQVKLGGKNSSKGGGKTPFCDITEGFRVDVITEDTNGDGVIDENDDASLFDQSVFTISCLDNPDTEEDETLYCPLSHVIWDVDEENTTSQATAQMFIGHTGAASVKSGKLKGKE
jgi:hypothetical protein